eukprot:CAMPEP_0183483598 /NCGR_PEP_ID=MMETSP0370-20130417/178494_1 /TAXON_ID=268820 /ORGANISM="Peridinium aciculiferum, Strain PAER-2" /LENGTH=185 /DNA_ID=CAMNT_0025676871 /DNA_START=180 /DNA_END=737 /DNA_ORIENTATION=+
MAAQPADPRRSHLGLVQKVQLHTLRAPRPEVVLAHRAGEGLGLILDLVEVPVSVEERHFEVHEVVLAHRAGEGLGLILDLVEVPVPVEERHFEVHLLTRLRDDLVDRGLLVDVQAGARAHRRVRDHDLVDGGSTGHAGAADGRLSGGTREGRRQGGAEQAESGAEGERRGEERAAHGHRFDQQVG